MARKKSNIHYIYKTTCKVTGRYYIGMHSTCNLEDGYMGSGKRLRHSIRKYGEENHIKEILEFLPDREKLIEREKECITSDMVVDNNCMNLKEGGTGGFINEEHRKKALKSSRVSYKKHLENDLEFRKKMFNVLLENVKKAHKDGKFKYGTFKNKHHSDETKQLMSETRKGTGIGKNNSQYGTCWITNNGENKKIKKEEIKRYIKKGWVKGRK